MAVHSRDQVEKLLETQRPGFFGGLWLLTKLTWRVIKSFGPHNWSLTRLAASEQKIQPGDAIDAEPIRHEGKVLK